MINSVTVAEVLNLSLAKVAKTEFVVPRSAPKNENEMKEQAREDFELRYEFLNNTGLDIGVTDRANITSVFHRGKHDEPDVARKSYHRRFVVRVFRSWYTPHQNSPNDAYTSPVKFDQYNTLSGYANDTDNELIALNNAFRMRIGLKSDRTYQGTVKRGYIGTGANYLQRLTDTMVVEYQYTIEELIANDGIVYFPEIDMVISIYDCASPRIPLHPYSKKAEIKEGFEGNPRAGKSDYYLRIEIIDDQHTKFGDRYVNVCGRVSKVKSSRDMRKQPGIYLFETASDGNGLTKHYIPFTDAKAIEALGLYIDRNSAENYGCPKAILDRKRHQEEIERKQLEADLNSKAREEQRLEALRKQEREDELYRRARENIDREERCRRESNSSEQKKRYWDGVFKIATGILALITAVLGLLIKFKSTTSKFV